MVTRFFYILFFMCVMCMTQDFYDDADNRVYYEHLRARNLHNIRHLVVRSNETAYKCTTPYVKYIKLDNVKYILEYANTKNLTSAQIAYVLATAHHETGGSFNSYLHEINRPAKYAGYHGRGYVQLTHSYNYKSIGKRINVDLLSYPDKASQPEIATIILVDGMMHGWYTNHKLTKYVNEHRTDFYNARRVVNSLDNAKRIAKHANEYLKILECN